MTNFSAPSKLKSPISLLMNKIDSQKTNRNNIDFFKYLGAAGAGALIGYSIKVPDKDILVKAA